MRKTMLLGLLVCLAGCGGSGDLTNPTYSDQTVVLKGTWNGQFPPSEGNEGVEVHFQPDYAFFVQEGQRVARQRLQVQQTGTQLVLTLTSQTDPQNQAIFTARSVTPAAIEGHYLNTFLGEDFDLILLPGPEQAETPKV